MRTFIYCFITLMLALEFAPPPGLSDIEIHDESYAEQGVPVRYQDLPNAIKKVLADEPYKDWEVTGAFVTEPEKKIYRIMLLRGSEMKSVTLDANGNQSK